jgi:hypothetical protein
VQGVPVNSMSGWPPLEPLYSMYTRVCERLWLNILHRLECENGVQALITALDHISTSLKGLENPASSTYPTPRVQRETGVSG